MAVRVENIFADPSEASRQEQFLTLFENEAVRIERIVSQSHSSPAGFWHDQSEDESVMVLRGHATLEFEGGELVGSSGSVIGFRLLFLVNPANKKISNSTD